MTSSRDRAPKRFDMTNLRLEHPYTPPKASDPEIAAIRKQLGEKSGTFMDQRLGIEMVRVLTRLPYSDPDTVHYINTRTSEMTYNSAYLSFDPYNRSTNMRWDLDLPLLAEDTEDGPIRLDQDRLLYLAHRDLDIAAVRASNLINALWTPDKELREKHVEQRGKLFARIAGNGALKLASLGLAVDYGNKTEFDIQHDVRQIALDLDQRARDAHHGTGVDTTLAFLATGDPNLVFRGAPDEAMNALEQVREQYT